MKRLILALLVGLLCSMYQAKAQWMIIDLSNLIQNIKGVVQSSTTATNMVRSLQESIKIYNQNKAYYDTPRSVHNIVRDTRKVKPTLEVVSEITEIYTSGFNRMVSDPNSTVGGLVAISAGYARLLEEDSALVAELETVMAGGSGLLLSDRERMDMADQIYAEVLKYRNLTYYYMRKTISVSFIRSREKGDAHRVLALCGNPDSRYW